MKRKIIWMIPGKPTQLNIDLVYSLTLIEMYFSNE